MNTEKARDALGFIETHYSISTKSLSLLELNISLIATESFCLCFCTYVSLLLSFEEILDCTIHTCTYLQDRTILEPPKFCHLVLKSQQLFSRVKNDRLQKAEA